MKIGIHIALASLLQKESVTAPIIGTTKMSHFKYAVGAYRFSRFIITINPNASQWVYDA